MTSVLKSVQKKKKTMLQAVFTLNITKKTTLQKRSCRLTFGGFEVWSGDGVFHNIGGDCGYLPFEQLPLFSRQQLHCEVRRNCNNIQSRKHNSWYLKEKNVYLTICSYCGNNESQKVSAFVSVYANLFHWQYWSTAWRACGGRDWEQVQVSPPDPPPHQD